MYDAKEIEEKDVNNEYTKYNCIYDRSYYQKVQSENMIKVKSAYVPRENVLE